ncbi:MAG TPA: HrpJ domain-containing protein [Chlamydiales bacterium]|nr:HrpJ domain-containing protein [Chlamydiales bacterium]
MSDPNISPILPINNQTVNQIRQEAKQSIAKPVVSQGNLSQYVENTLFNPTQQAQRFRDLEKLKHSQTKEKVENPEEEKIEGVENAEEVATRFSRGNPELEERTLAILQSLINPNDTAEETLAKVFSVYPDPALADEALDFLIETARPDTLDILQQTKALLNRDYERQVKAGRNISALAREFSKEGLGSPTSLRDMYRDVTGNPRAPLKLFDELSEKYPYAKLKTVITFLLHSLGQDLKSKGPSIDPGNLARLIEETRSLQGILGVYRFFQSRSKLIDQQFQAMGFPRPPQLNFETLARLLIKMLQERFVNPEKILQTAKMLGIEEEVQAQILTYSQMYDALRQISPRYYRNQQQRNDLAKSFVDTLEQLDDKLEDEKEEKKKKKK